MEQHALVAAMPAHLHVAFVSMLSFCLVGCTVIQRNPMTWEGGQYPLRPHVQHADEQECSDYAVEAAREEAQRLGWRPGLVWMPLGLTPGLLISTDNGGRGPADPRVRGQYYRACMRGKGYVPTE